MQKLIENLYDKYHKLSNGHLASYIPELAKVNPDYFAITIATTDGKIYTVGDSTTKFSLQSSSKPFTYGYALETYGRDFIRTKVGVEPTGKAFNSIVELEKKTHRPYNPMINSGAITITSLVPGKNEQERFSKILGLFNNLSGSTLNFDQQIYESESKTAHRNKSIAHLLRHFNIIDEKIDESLELYFKQCSIMATSVDLAWIGATIANSGVNPLTKTRAISDEYISDIVSLMFTCGMYDSSGEWAYSVGIPAKSGVSGCIVGVIPGVMGISVYSPLIDMKGHSVRGVQVIKDLSKELGLSIFETRNKL